MHSPAKLLQQRGASTLCETLLVPTGSYITEEMKLVLLVAKWPDSSSQKLAYWGR